MMFETERPRISTLRLPRLPDKPIS